MEGKRIFAVCFSKKVGLEECASNLNSNDSSLLVKTLGEQM